MTQKSGGGKGGGEQITGLVHCRHFREGVGDAMSENCKYCSAYIFY